MCVPLLALLPLSPMVLGCNNSPRVLSIEIVTGHETDAMTADPPVERVEVEGTSPEGTTISAEAPPGGDLDFGDVDGDLAYQFEVTGFDSEGTKILRGRSKGGIVLNGIDGEVFPLFAQRLGTWARPPGELEAGHSFAPATSLFERYLVTTGGTGADGGGAKQIDTYDLFAWTGGTTEETMPFAAETLVSTGSTALAIGGEEARLLDDTGIQEIALPEGLTSWDELSGGTAVNAPSDDGRVFIVGPTRAAKSADAVLEIASDGTLTVRRLTYARAGAAAAWLPDVGLVVVGGNLEGEDTAKSVEVLSAAGTDFAVRDYPADRTAGAAAAATELGILLLVGGALDGAPAKTRFLDPTCKSDCAAEDIDSATPPIALTRAAAFSYSTGLTLVTGDDIDPTGTTRTFVIDYLEQTLTELPLREPRRGATATPASPNGTLALMGGTHPDGTPALTVEMFFPE